VHIYIYIYIYIYSKLFFIYHLVSLSIYLFIVCFIKWLLIFFLKCFSVDGSLQDHHSQASDEGSILEAP
jgi:hypothetical protein